MGQEIINQIKIDFSCWFKENFPGDVPKRKSLKDIVGMIRHEMIHINIYRKLVKGGKISLEMYFTKENSYRFSYGAKCLVHYPLSYNRPQCYPKYVFIEFVQCLYDMIYGIFLYGIFFNFIPCIIGFLKTLFKLKITEKETK